MADGSFLAVATDPGVVKRATKIALIAGVSLALINHGHRLIVGEVHAATLVRTALAFFGAPFGLDLLLGSGCEELDADI